MSDIVTDAVNLMTWLRLPGAEARYTGANVMAGYLEILLDSCTPEEATEALEFEIERIKKIICGNSEQGDR